MNNMDYLMCMYMCFMSFIMFCLYYKHLLLLIISLEFIVVLIIYNMYMMMMMLESSMFLILFMLIFFVCEGALSLSLIVLMVRYYGNDYMKSLSILKW